MLLMLQYYLHQGQQHRRQNRRSRRCGGQHCPARPSGPIIMLKRTRRRIDCGNSSSPFRLLLLLTIALLVLLFGAGSCHPQPLRTSKEEVEDADHEHHHLANESTNNNNNTIISVVDTAQLMYPLHAVSGTLHVNVWIGQPAVLQTLIVDSGSRFTAMPCSQDDGVNNNNGRRYQQQLHPHAHAPLNASSASLRRTIACPHCRLSAESCGSSSTASRQTAGGKGAAGRSGVEQQQQQQQCIIQQAYTEGSSWTATEVNDMVALAGETSSLFRTIKQQQRQEQQVLNDLNHGLVFTFGCQFQVTGLFAQQYANGILGLQRSRHSIVESMARQGILPHASFSLCIGTAMDSDSKRSSGIADSATSSWLGLGGALTPLHVSDMKFTFMPNTTTTSPTTTSTAQHTTGYFRVHVEQVWLGHDEYDKVVVASIDTTPEIMMMGFQTGKGTILDSGTTDTYLPNVLRTAMEGAWLNYTSNINGGDPVSFEYSERQRSYMYTHDEFQRYIPPIHLVLHNNVVVTLDPLNYMEGARGSSSNNNNNNNYSDSIPWQGRRKLTNRVYVDEPMGAVLGLNAMMGHDIYFENKRAASRTTSADGSMYRQRIGIAPANCATLAETSVAATSSATTTTSQT
jgi:Xylanase inhibitor N-terminal